MRIFSGIQPTGAKHLGNYSGGFRQYAATQEEGDAFFCIVDLHSITVEYDPENLRTSTLDLAATLFATGPRPGALDGLRAEPRRRARRGGLAALGRDELRAAGTHDAVQGEGRASGIRLGWALHVSRADGRRHPAVPDRPRADRRRPAPASRARARLAERFNTRFGETFTVPEGRLSRIGARVMDLQEPTNKMATTGGTAQGTILCSTRRT